DMLAEPEKARGVGWARESQSHAEGSWLQPEKAIRAGWAS
ncbi:hypothetical protein A2U01_0084834, partial [Trifolium medium]|nr:hypothetical protein [Trifolium medium]